MDEIKADGARNALQEVVKIALGNNAIDEDINKKILFYSNIWMSIVAPALIGFGVNYFSSSEDKFYQSTIFWLVMVVFLLIHIILITVQNRNNEKLSSLSQLSALKEEHESLRDELAKAIWTLREVSNLGATQMAALSLATHVTDASIGQLDLVIRNAQQNDLINAVDFRKMLNQHLKAMLFALSHEREQLFSYKSESKYNIALYVYDSRKEHLKVAHRECDNRIQRHDRTWKPGLGHVGLAFLYKEVKICADIELSSELPTKELEQDEQNYRSFLSLPIMRCDDDGDPNNDKKPWGVIVLTSALANQFDDKRDKTFMEMFAKLLAIYFSAADNYYQMYGISDEHRESDPATGTGGNNE